MQHSIRFIISAIVVCTLAAPMAHAGVIFEGFSWALDQGGLVQADHENFQVHQSTTTGSGAVHNVEQATRGGAFFQSSISITADASPTAGGFSVALTCILNISASVDQGWPDGLAQAYAAIDILSAVFTITGLPHVYVGSAPLIDADGMMFESGSVLPPGTYDFLEFDVAFLITDTIGPGEMESADMEIEHFFGFTPIPAPGAGVVLASAMMIGRRRRR